MVKPNDMAEKFSFKWGYGFYDGNAEHIVFGKAYREIKQDNAECSNRDDRAMVHEMSEREMTAILLEAIWGPTIL